MANRDVCFKKKIVLHTTKCKYRKLPGLANKKLIFRHIRVHKCNLKNIMPSSVLAKLFRLYVSVSVEISDAA